MLFGVLAVGDHQRKWRVDFCICRQIVFEDAYGASDSCTLEQLKELSSKRRLIEESINESSSITEAIAREMSGGLTSHSLQVSFLVAIRFQNLKRALVPLHCVCRNIGLIHLWNLYLLIMLLIKEKSKLWLPG